MKCETLIAYHIADSVLQVALSANRKTFDELKKEDPVMCDALKELMRPEMEEEVNKAVNKAVNIAVDKAVNQNTIEVNDHNIKDLIKNGASLDLLNKTFGVQAVNRAIGKQA